MIGKERAQIDIPLKNFLINYTTCQ